MMFSPAPCRSPLLSNSSNQPAALPRAAVVRHAFLMDLPKGLSMVVLLLSMPLVGFCQAALLDPGEFLVDIPSLVSPS